MIKDELNDKNIFFVCENDKQRKKIERERILNEIMLWIEGKKLNGLNNGYKSHSQREYLWCQDAEKTPIKIDECENPVEILC